MMKISGFIHSRVWNTNPMRSAKSDFRERHHLENKTAILLSGAKNGLFNVNVVALPDNSKTKAGPI